MDGKAVSSHSHVISDVTNLQSTLDTKASTSDVAVAVQALVAETTDSNVNLLNTLTELSTALGNDENFATTVANSIGAKVAKAGDTMTGNLTVPSVDVTGNLDVGGTIEVDGNISLLDGSTAKVALQGYSTQLRTTDRLGFRESVQTVPHRRYRRGGGLGRHRGYFAYR